MSLRAISSVSRVAFVDVSTPEAAILRVLDHVDDPRVEERLAPRVEDDRLREGRDLVDDRRVEVPLHEALGPGVDVEARRAHDAVEVADVRRLDVDAVRERRSRLQLELVGRRTSPPCSVCCLTRFLNRFGSVRVSRFTSASPRRSRDSGRTRTGGGVREARTGGRSSASCSWLTSNPRIEAANPRAGVPSQLGSVSSPASRSSFFPSYAVT